MICEDEFRLLVALCDKADEYDALDESEELERKFPEATRKAFRNMRGQRRLLSEKQRAWIRAIYERVFETPTYENLASSGKLARGREVELMVDKMPKPLKPPSRCLGHGSYYVDDGDGHRDKMPCDDCGKDH